MFSLVSLRKGDVGVAATSIKDELNRRTGAARHVYCAKGGESEGKVRACTRAESLTLYVYAPFTAE